jgi:hypothetical protein
MSKDAESELLSVTHTRPGACLSINGVTALTCGQLYIDPALRMSYFRSDIFGCEPGPSTADDQIDRISSVSPVPDCLLDCEYTIRHDLGLCDIPLVVSGVAEHILQDWYALVSRRILGCCLRHNQNGGLKLRLRGAHVGE